MLHKAMKPANETNFIRAEAELIINEVRLYPLCEM
jgi:hypothetical protein